MSLTVFLFWASLYVYVPILPVHAERLGASFAGVGVVVAAYGLPQLLFRIPIGLWSDRIGRRRPFGLMALVACAVGAAGLAFAPDPLTLTAARFVTGIAAAFWVILSIHYALHFPPHQSVLAMGRANALNSFAQVGAALAGGAIAGLGDLRLVFLAGLALAIVGVGAYAGVEDRPAGSAAAAPFSRRGLPVGDLARYSTIMALAVGVGFATTFGFLPLLARDVGTPTELLGTLAAVRVLALGITALFVHQVVVRLGHNPSIALGLLLLGATTALSALAPEPVSLILLQVVGGVGFGLISPLTMSGAVQAAAAGSRATAMGVYQATYSVGMTGMPLAAGLLASAFGLRSVFFACGALCLFAMLLCFSGARRPR
ncbi:MAG: MFS transporter [Chloroflexota bacterium]|nr:MFS transporter [Chloroflexota bacterium]